MPKFFLQTATHNTASHNGDNAFHSNVVTTAEDIEEAKAKIHRNWLRPVVDKDTPFEKFIELSNFADGVLIHADYPQTIIFCEEENHVTLEQVIEISQDNYEFLTKNTHVTIVE